MNFGDNISTLFQGEWVIVMPNCSTYSSEKRRTKILGIKHSCNFAWDFCHIFRDFLDLGLKNMLVFGRIEILQDFYNFRNFFQIFLKFKLICTGFGIFYYFLRRFLEFYAPRVWQWSWNRIKYHHSCVVVFKSFISWVYKMILLFGVCFFLYFFCW